MRYWIMDQDKSPQRFPLQRLLRQVREVVGVEVSTCQVFKVRGYGESIHKWEEELDTAEVIEVPVEVADRLSEGTDEWFYDLEAQLSGTDVRFGLHDSTALFVDANPTVAEKITLVFNNVRQAQ